MSGNTSEIESTAEILKQRYSLRELATQYHHAISTIFGDEVRSSDIDGAIRSQTKDFLAESIALVRQEDASQIPEYLQKDKDGLRNELKSALSDYGITQPQVTTNIGPTVPHLLAIAYRDYDTVESTI